MQDAGLRHIASALARLEPGGRLVAISGANCSPDEPARRRAFVALQETARIVFTAGIDGHIYAKHGTSIDTQLRSEEHTSELQPLMRMSYSVFGLKKTKKSKYQKQSTAQHS